MLGISALCCVHCGSDGHKFVPRCASNSSIFDYKSQFCRLPELGFDKTQLWKWAHCFFYIIILKCELCYKIILCDIYVHQRWFDNNEIWYGGESRSVCVRFSYFHSDRINPLNLCSILCTDKQPSQFWHISNSGVGKYCWASYRLWWIIGTFTRILDKRLS